MASLISLKCRSGYSDKPKSERTGLEEGGLLRMGAEIMETGNVHVWRGGIDAEELCHIRGGGWPYEKLIEWAEQKQNDLNERYKTENIAVPHKPDRDAIDALCVRILESSFSNAKS